MARHLLVFVAFTLSTPFASSAFAHEDCGPPTTRVIHINAGNSAEFEAVARDPNYANARIELAPGSYVLKNVLNLQAGQSIVGQQEYVDHDHDGVWDPVNPKTDPADAHADYVKGKRTVIDLSHVQTYPTNSFGIAMHPGNSLEGVTIQGAGGTVEIVNNLKMVICTGDPAGEHQHGAPCRVSNTVILDTAAGLGAVYAGPGSPVVSVSGRYTVSFENNVVSRSGVASLIESGLDNVVVSASLRRNRFTASSTAVDGGGYGLFTNANGSSNTYEMVTVGNVFDKNDISGVLITAGLSGIPFPGAPVNRNRVDWTSVNDVVTRNGNTPAGGGGINLIPLIDANPTPTSHGNSIVADLIGTVFVQSCNGGGQNSAALTDSTGNVTGSFQEDILEVPDAVFTGDPTPKVVGNNVSLRAHGLVSNTQHSHTSTFYAYLGVPNNATNIYPDTQKAFERANPAFLWRVDINPTGPQ